MITINYYDLRLQKIHMTIKTESREIKMGEKMTPEQFVKKKKKEFVKKFNWFYRPLYIASS